jgi:hypothetical protein
MWSFIGDISSSCDECSEVHVVPISDFNIESAGSEYHENGMGQENNYELSFEFDCTRCGSEIHLSFNATEYPLDVLSYVIDNTIGASCENEPSIEYLPDFEEIYLLPEPKLILPEERIITDVSLLRSNIPELIRFLSQNPEQLHQISPREFEEIIAEIFRSKGFEVALTASTRDGGKDIIAVHRNELGIDTQYFIECKRYIHSNKVGVELIRSLHGVKNTRNGPNKVILATTSTFTSGAIDFAQNQATSEWDITLKDYYDILRWLKSY